MALKKDDLFYIEGKLWDARAKWKTIGLGLKIPLSDLEVIDQDKDDIDGKFESMITRWLKNGKDCTWEALCKVLSARPVGHADLAEEIRREYCTGVAEADRACPQPMQTESADPDLQGKPLTQPVCVSPVGPLSPPADSAQHQLPSHGTFPSETDSYATTESEATSRHKLAHPDTPAMLVGTTLVHAPREPTMSDQVEGETPQSGARELSLTEGITLRGYQEELASPGLQGKSYMLVAPTGSGKTLVAGYVIMCHLNKMLRDGKRGKVVFVTPTRQLTFQQKTKLQEYVPGIRAVEITGASGRPMHPLVQSNDVDVIVCTAGKLRGELKTEAVKVTDLSLVVLDECHHAGRPSNYSDIMEFHIRQKLAGPTSPLPQVVGMTASPGAGRGKPHLITVMDHQLSLCATVDATAGIVAVGMATEKLESVRNAPKSYLEVSDERSPSDLFIQRVNSAMEKLEQCIVGSTPCLERGSSKYNSWLQNEKEAAENRQEDERQRISVLDQLSVYSQSLVTYHDFRYEDAVSMLEEIQEFKDQSTFERSLFTVHRELMKKLSTLPKSPNPLLERMESILREQFARCPQSKGIFFVRAVKHTRYVTNWIASSPALSRVIKATPITGYSRGGMEKSEQLRVLEGFRRGTYNLLASTSVLEEGLDVPECNFVIRYQNVSNEIAQVQAKGRARAGDSRMYTVVSSNSNKDYLYLVQEEKQRLVEASLSVLQDYPLEQVIPQKQKLFVEERERKAQQMRALRGLWPEPERVEILCKKCNVLACKTPEVYAYTLSFDDNPHHVVPGEAFSSRYVKKEHDKPAVSDNFVKPYKIYCGSPSCRIQWGVIATWRDTGYTFPVLKCESFLFKYGDSTRKFKKWKDIWFEVKSIQDWAEVEDNDIIEKQQ